MMGVNNNINGLCLMIMADIKKHGGKTGYDLTKLIPNSSHQQVYRELGKLQEFGFVSFDVVPQEDKPDKKVYTIVKSIKTQKFFNQAISQLPINKNVPVNSLEGVERSLDYADPSVVADWCERFIKTYTQAKLKAAEQSLSAEVAIRSAHIKFAKETLKRAEFRIENEAVA